MKFISTRGGEQAASPKAILQGLASDGGLFVPSEFPHLSTNPVSKTSLANLSGLSYKDLALEIISMYFDEFSREELKDCIDKAYSVPKDGPNPRFDTDLIAPVVKKADCYFCELYHGRTLAFKDFALSLLPYLLKLSAKELKMDQKTLILTATSGDTGKAALEAFCDVEGTSVAVYYPEKGVSMAQKRQMITQEGSNTIVIGIEGNFDQAQTGVKNLFSDHRFRERMHEKGYRLSSANSINIGRLVPQIVYYFYAYFRLLEQEKLPLGTPVNFCVPTGNFGNILAANYAKEMGLPIQTLICASNDNKVLYDFFATKVYDINRSFITTVSPSMDILISSNLERLLYKGNLDFEKTKALMESLSRQGRYTYEAAMADIVGEYATQEDTLQTIKTLYEESGYIIDTHTAVALHAYKQYCQKTKDETKTIIMSTASPFKFAATVLSALQSDQEAEGATAIEAATTAETASAVEALDTEVGSEGQNAEGSWAQQENQAKRAGQRELALLRALAEKVGSMPKQLEELYDLPIRHKTVCKVSEMENTLLKKLFSNE